MITLIMILLILSSIVLMAVVLMQSSKGNGLAGPIGGSSVTMTFGVRRTSDFLSKSTTVLAAIIMVGSIAVNLLIGNSGSVEESMIQKNAGQQQLPPQNTLPPTETGTPDVAPGTNDQNADQNQGQTPVTPQKTNTPDQKSKEVEPAGP
ncbi:MAG: preprotein translocase subunit SecG [Ignavibacteria bacterium]|nr:preprotein translocase subunit SecG [Ignavibacteria bacterium]